LNAVSQRSLEARATCRDNARQDSAVPGRYLRAETAGSDLASLQDRRRARWRSTMRGNRQKGGPATASCPTGCQLVRTDPGARKKQTGITFSLSTGKTPGGTSGPSVSSAEASPFCETFSPTCGSPIVTWSRVDAGLDGGEGPPRARKRAMIANVMGSGGRRDGARVHGTPGRKPPPHKSPIPGREHARGKRAPCATRGPAIMDELGISAHRPAAADAAKDGQQRPGRRRRSSSSTERS